MFTKEHPTTSRQARSLVRRRRASIVPHLGENANTGIVRCQQSTVVAIVPVATLAITYGNHEGFRHTQYSR